MEKLNQLVGKCIPKVVDVNINSHRPIYETVEQYLMCHFNNEQEMIEDIGEDVLNEMINTNYIIEIFFCPYTVIGHVMIFHYNLDMALDLALKYFKNE